MKALEILEESKKINEAPSALGQVGRRVGAAALGAIGMKNTAAGLSGKADLVAKSREYYAAYKKFLGRIGKSEDDADLTDLRDFYIKNGLPADDVPTIGPADKDTVFKILQKTASDVGRGRSTKTTTEPSNSTVNSGSTVNKMSLDQIQSAVDSLSASEKAQLLKYLQSQPTTASPGQVRQAKQAKAAQAAQAQMNTPVTAPQPTAAKSKRSRRRSRRAANVAV
jgi:hypothetical protein